MSKMKAPLLPLQCWAKQIGKVTCCQHGVLWPTYPWPLSISSASLSGIRISDPIFGSRSGLEIIWIRIQYEDSNWLFCYNNSHGKKNFMWNSAITGLGWRIIVSYLKDQNHIGWLVMLAESMFARQEWGKGVARGDGGIPPKPKIFCRKLVLFPRALFLVTNFRKNFPTICVFLQNARNYRIVR